MQEQLETYFLSSSRFYRLILWAFYLKLLEFFMNQGTNYSELYYHNSYLRFKSISWMGICLTHRLAYTYQYNSISSQTQECLVCAILQCGNLHYFDFVSWNVLKMEGHTYKFISADDVSNEIIVVLLNRR